MKLATWNVNGIRARQAQVQEWIAQERPDVVCLQEIKATTDQIPIALCEMEGYWCYWHGGKGYSGVAMWVNKDFIADRPAFAHPAFDYENRIVTVEASYVESFRMMTVMFVEVTMTYIMLVVKPKKSRP